MIRLARTQSVSFVYDVCPRVLGYYDRIKMIFYLLPSIVSLSIGLSCFILVFWGSSASIPIVLWPSQLKQKNANVAKKSIVVAR